MMTTAQTERSHRTTVLRVAAATWLLLISAVVVIDHVILSTRADRTEDAVPATQLSELEAQLAELAREIEQQRQEPAALPLGRYESERVALDQRLEALEQAVDDRPTVDLQSLQTRIDRLEVRLATVRSAPTDASRPPVRAPARPRPVEPSFRVIGVELRAGERFLSILPADASALSQARLLRAGETEAGWRLEVIEDGTAVFRHGDEVRRLTVPER
jgi:outer membrane murein-binding lipoprotein Lpp